MSFQARRAKREARTWSWATTATRGSQAPAPAPVYDVGPKLAVAHDACGRAIHASCDVSAGDTLLVQDAYVAVLSTSQAPRRCHHCMSESPQRECTSCKFARYCDAKCEAAAHRAHAKECIALQRWFTRTEHAPDADVRALARLLWAREHYDAAWWARVSAMAANRRTMHPRTREEAAGIAYRLGTYVGDERDALGMTSPDALMELVCQHETNAFTLSDAHLNGLGVCVNPVLALVNHACDANAAVVFPTETRGVPSQMHLVAMRPIRTGESVLISYVDTTSEREARQRTLLEKYAFTCTCALCERAGPGWHDPRTALWCPLPMCEGWVQACEQGWTQCTQCRQVPHDMETRGLAEAAGVTPRLQHALSAGPLSARDARIMHEMLYTLTRVAPPSHHLVLPLLLAAHTHAIEHRAWDDAVQCAMLAWAGMQARGARDARSALLPHAHPQRATVLAALFHLLCMDTPVFAKRTRFLARPPPFPCMQADTPQRMALTQNILTQALDEARIAFGTASGGGAIYQRLVSVLV